MIGNALQLSVNSFKKNISLVLYFGTLLVFVLFFSLFTSNFVSSGSIFFDYSSKDLSILLMIIQLIAGIIFIALFSFYNTLIVFSAKSAAEGRKKHYLQERLFKIFKRLFLFYLIYLFLMILIGSSLYALFIPMQLSAIILFLLSLPLFFMPQAIVVEEESLFTCFLKNIDFILSNSLKYFFVLALTAILIILLQFIELAFDQFFFVGRFISLLIVFFLIIPFIEILKTKVYLQKFGLAKAVIE